MSWSIPLQGTAAECGDQLKAAVQHSCSWDKGLDVLSEQAGEGARQICAAIDSSDQPYIGMSHGHVDRAGIGSFGLHLHKYYPADVLEQTKTGAAVTTSPSSSAEVPGVIATDAVPAADRRKGK